MPSTSVERAPALPRRPRAARGFTLIEAGMVTVIIGIGVLSMLQLLAAGSVQNVDANTMTTAMTLASNVREMSLGMAFFDPDQPAAGPHTWDSREATVLAYDNVTDLDGNADTWDKPENTAGWQKFSPPIDGTRKEVAGYANWAQYVKVETVSPGQVRTVLPQDPEAEAARVTVKITKDNKEVYRSSWVIFAPLAKNP